MIRIQRFASILVLAGWIVPVPFALFPTGQNGGAHRPPAGRAGDASRRPFVANPDQKETRLFELEKRLRQHLLQAEMIGRSV